VFRAAGELAGGVTGTGLLSADVELPWCRITIGEALAPSGLFASFLDRMWITCSGLRFLRSGSGAHVSAGK